MAQSKLVAVYCIDTSSLINLKHFPRDLFPTIWEKIETLVKNGQWIAPAEVQRELSTGDDIHKWCKKHKSIFVDPTAEQIACLQKVKKHYDKSHWNVQIQKTGAWADPWVVALAMTQMGAVVADEGMGNTKIPYICQKVNVKCMDRFGLMREIGVKY